MTIKFRLCLLLWAFIASSVSFAQFDLNGDGRVEVVLVGENGDGGLDWYAQDLYSGELLRLGTFGQSGFPATFGNWGSDDTLRRGAIIRDEEGFFHLMAEGYSGRYTLTRNKSTSWVLLNGDINGSLLDDVVIVQRDRMRNVWSLFFDYPHVKQSTMRKKIFGSTKDIPLIFRKRGKQKNLGLLQAGNGARATRISIVH
jgi:hypothetical protein